MKLAITGKGGVGKTTLASLLARIFAAEGRPVVAIDANPDANLGAALGIPQEELERLTPIAEMKELVLERTGAQPGTIGGMFKLNPEVADIPDRFCAREAGIRLLVMGTVKAGGSGCLCPESALLKALVRHLLVGEFDVVIMDMDAGVEHLGRGTAGAVDAFIVVVEPGQRSFQTARAVRSLAEDLGVKQCYAVGNKVRSDQDREFISSNLPEFEILGFLSYRPGVQEADLQGVSAFDLDPGVVAEARAIKDRLDHLHPEKR